tara:strand:- start:622 stop:1422 length:801 start_codon:yes stop_codon:yes gene_type:complete
MKLYQTAERISHKDLLDNFVFQRSLLAYVEAANIVFGDVLEIGTGSGYGVELIASHADKFITIDKYEANHLIKQKNKSQNVEFIKMNIPPLKNIPDSSFDFVITFQVIEHIKKDKEFIQEIYRVLKTKGKLIITTPNIKMSLTRNPWHIREYTVSELSSLLSVNFQSVKKLGVFGNKKIMEYYNRNKKSVERITRFDIFNFQYILPRQLLQIPYDLANRINRRKLFKDNTSLASGISMSDYYLGQVSDECFDLFYIVEKCATPNNM